MIFVGGVVSFVEFDRGVCVGSVEIVQCLLVGFVVMFFCQWCGWCQGWEIEVVFVVFVVGVDQCRGGVGLFEGFCYYVGDGLVVVGYFGFVE